MKEKRNTAKEKKKKNKGYPYKKISRGKKKSELKNLNKKEVKND